LSSMRIICPNRVSRRDWIIAVSLGCFVSLHTSSFRTIQILYKSVIIINIILPMHVCHCLIIPGCFTRWRFLSVCLSVCFLFLCLSVCRLKGVFVGHWSDWLSSAIVLAAVSGGSTAGPVRPLINILLAARSWFGPHWLVCRAGGMYGGHSATFYTLGMRSHYNPYAQPSRAYQWH